MNSPFFQVLHHGKNQGFILIVLGKFQGGEIRKASDMVDKTLDIQLHLQGAVPFLKGKHGSPVKLEEKNSSVKASSIFLS